MKATEDPVGLMVEAWCSPTLVSPAGRPCSVMQLEEQQAAGPADINNPYLEDTQWDMEAMVLSTIAGQLEDEEEEEEKEVRNQGFGWRNIRQPLADTGACLFPALSAHAQLRPAAQRMCIALCMGF